MTGKTSDTVTIRLGTRTLAYVQELALLAGVTPNQAISVLLALGVKNDLEPITVNNVIGKEEEPRFAVRMDVPVCERHEIADPQCDQCNGWPSTDAPVDRGQQHPVTKEWSGKGYKWDPRPDDGGVQWVKTPVAEVPDA